MAEGYRSFKTNISNDGFPFFVFIVALRTSEHPRV